MSVSFIKSDLIAREMKLQTNMPISGAEKYVYTLLECLSSGNGVELGFSKNSDAHIYSDQSG